MLANCLKPFKAAWEMTRFNAKRVQLLCVFRGFQNQSASTQVVTELLISLSFPNSSSRALWRRTGATHLKGWGNVGSVESGELLHPFIAVLQSLLSQSSFSPSAFNSAYHYAGPEWLPGQLSNGPISGTGTRAKKPSGEGDEKTRLDNGLWLLPYSFPKPIK